MQAIAALRQEEKVREHSGYDVLVRKHDHQQRCELSLQDGS
jgi:hypothetical protein